MNVLYYFTVKQAMFLRPCSKDKLISNRLTVQASNGPTYLTGQLLNMPLCSGC